MRTRTLPGNHDMRDLPDDNRERTLFDRADLERASRILANEKLAWVIATAVGARDANQHEQRQCVEALAEAVEVQLADGTGRAIRLAALLCQLGLQPTDEAE